MFYQCLALRVLLVLLDDLKLTKFILTGQHIIITLENIIHVYDIAHARAYARTHSLKATRNYNCFNCCPQGSDGVTHTERSDKSRVLLHWTAPSTQVGNVVIM